MVYVCVAFAHMFRVDSLVVDTVKNKQKKPNQKKPLPKNLLDYGLEVTMVAVVVLSPYLKTG